MFEAYWSERMHATLLVCDKSTALERELFATLWMIVLSQACQGCDDVWSTQVSESLCRIKQIEILKDHTRLQTKL